MRLTQVVRTLSTNRDKDFRKAVIYLIFHWRNHGFLFYTIIYIDTNEGTLEDSTAIPNLSVRSSGGQVTQSSQHVIEEEELD